ncbi:hypothetical protein [Nonomuraea sp. NPDC049709]|uniref:hypothetical protein n=1 Tax=Nonomuraea sp. NPDC049709 TaxID=3154736 RepID=UPI00344281C4
MTPTPTPSPNTKSLIDDINWDAVSGVADSVMAIGTVLTLLFIARTVRQQGKALSLQITQLQDLQASKEQARKEAERSKQELKMRQMQGVRVNPHTLRSPTPADRNRPGTSPSRRLTEMIDDEHHADVGEEHQWLKWEAAAIRVDNQSGTVIHNVSCHGDALPRSTWVWRESVAVLLDIYEIDQLAPGTAAWYVWFGPHERELVQQNASIHFSDEDGGRWATDLHNHTTRVDHLSS